MIDTCIAECKDSSRCATSGVKEKCYSSTSDVYCVLLMRKADCWVQYNVIGIGMIWLQRRQFYAYGGRQRRQNRQTVLVWDIRWPVDWPAFHQVYNCNP